MMGFERTNRNGLLWLVLLLLVSIVNGAVIPDSESEDPDISDLLVLDIHQSISKNKEDESVPLGTIIIGLFGSVVPKTANNFKQLAPVYAEMKTSFHRVIPGFVIQAGDIDGHGGHSVYGDKGAPAPEGSNPALFGSQFSGLEDENFILTHNKYGRVSVANAGPNTGGSQFFICLGPTPHLDGHHVVFGQVLKGMDVAEVIAATDRDSQDKPLNEVFIFNAHSETFVDMEQVEKLGTTLISETKSVENSEDSEDSESSSTGSETESQSDILKEAEELNEHTVLENQQYEENHPTGLGGSRRHYVFIPFAAFILIAGFMAYKNRRTAVSMIRGPRYRRI